MGLAERRAAKEFREQQFPALEAEIRAAAGFDLALEVDWDSLAKDDYASMYAASWPKVYFQPLIESLKSITRDDLGREALAGGLERVVIRNTTGYYSPYSAITFESKVLTIDHDPVTNVDDVNDRTEHMTKLLEKSL
jgi:hypothetical protein